MADNKLYTKDSIESLSPRDFTRLRPGVYCGSTEYSTQLLLEIVSNAIDEHKAGHGNKIEVTLKSDGICVVRDYGQGFIPNEYREDGETILQASFDVLNTSGKFNNDGVYEGTALGLNGIGAKLTNYLSNWLEVTTWRDNKFEQIRFEEGIFKKRTNGTYNQKELTGTLVTWKASKEFFNSVDVEIEKVKKMFHVLTCLCQGLTIVLKTPTEEITYYSEHGLNDLIDDEVQDKEILKKRMNLNYKKDKNAIDLVLTYTSNYSLNMISYVNTGGTDSGPHITQIKTIITREFNKFFRDKQWLKEKDENLSGDDIQEGMFIAFNITAPSVSYDAQTKSRIVKIDMTPFTGVIAEQIQYWLNNDEKEIKIIFDKAVAARKAREAAKKARDNARGIKKEKNKILNLPTKLVDAWSKNRNDCELLISEGDSAAAGLIGARDGEFQAIFPIRGKLINLYKNSSDKVFANQEVVNIIKAIGLELDSKTNQMKYDRDKLRYGKIIMCCDADPDGQAIKNLLLTYFWALCPELVIQGHIYAAIPPLFRITTKKNEYIYLKDGDALEKYKQEHVGEKFLVNRNKGLGEQDPEELNECLLDKQTRNVVQITVEDVKKTDDLFDIFMGTSVPPRREYILKYSEEAQI